MYVVKFYNDWCDKCIDVVNKTAKSKYNLYCI